MKEFFLVLFFGKVILLTPNPIDVGGPMELIFDTPITAITSGASLLVDVSSMVSKKDRESIWQSDERLTALFPDGSIIAKLTGNGNDEVLLEFNGGYLIGNDTIELTLNAEGGFPTGVVFNKIIIESSVELSRVKISWKNYKH